MQLRTFRRWRARSKILAPPLPGVVDIDRRIFDGRQGKEAVDAVVPAVGHFGKITRKFQSCEDGVVPFFVSCGHGHPTAAGREHGFSAGQTAGQAGGRAGLIRHERIGQRMKPQQSRFARISPGSIHQAAAHANGEAYFRAVAGVVWVAEGVALGEERKVVIGRHDTGVGPKNISQDDLVDHQLRNPLDVEDELRHGPLFEFVECGSAPGHDAPRAVAPQEDLVGVDLVIAGKSLEIAHAGVYVLDAPIQGVRKGQPPDKRIGFGRGPAQAKIHRGDDISPLGQFPGQVNQG